MNATLTRQVNALANQMDGWFDDREPYSSQALAWLGRVLDHLVAAFEVPIPYLYPTAHGFVRAGWATPRWDVIAEIDLTTHRVAVFARDAATLQVRERRLSLEAKGAASQLGRFVAGHTR